VHERFEFFVVGEVERCVGVRWRAGGGVGVLRTRPVAAGVRVYSSVGGKYLALELFFVSARTNKRHHHHHHL